VKNWCLVVLLLAGFACKQKRQLPILGERNTQTIQKNGQSVVDTIYKTVDNFELLSQDSSKVSQADYRGKKVYVAEFFFSTCPTICPKMKTQLLRVYKQYQSNPSFGILSHTIDPKHDTPSVLKAYAKDLHVNTSVWTFVTGPKKIIYKLGQQSYYTTAQEDSLAEGGFIHSGALTLVDKKGRIRGMYDGTDPEKVDLLLEDIQILLDEK
jgi:protein SCO1